MTKERGRTERNLRDAQEPRPELVYFVDHGTVLDAPLETVWDFMEDEKFHPRAHKTSLRNFEGKALSEVTNLISYEVREGGKWRRNVSRLTEIRPSVRILEVLEGPNAGSKTVHLYTPRGKRTTVDVFCYMRSDERSPEELERDQRKIFARAHREDLPWFREFIQSQRSRK